MAIGVGFEPVIDTHIQPMKEVQIDEEIEEDEPVEITIDEKLSNTMKCIDASITHESKTKMARSFIKNCLCTTGMDEADAISFIEIEMRSAFGFNDKEGKSTITSLKSYYRNLTKPKSMKPIMEGGCSKTLADRPDKEAGCECKSVDPMDIDFDEKDIDPALLEWADDEAEHILTTGNPVQYIKDSVAEFHTGDEDTVEGLCISTAGQSVTNTDGIQIAVNGDSGSGKSHVAKCLLHHILAKWKRRTDLSAKALYYMNLKPGMTIFSDDKDMDPDLAALFKQSTTCYQEYTYRNVVKNHEPLLVSIPPRMNLLITCVESHVSDQVLNRQLVFETDPSDKQKYAIYQKQKQNEKDKITKLTVTPAVLVCRRIFTKMKEHTFNVSIPFVDKIDFADRSNTRIQPLLFDMIRGYTMFKFKQRQIDEDGWLVATYEDYYSAEKLFKSRAENTLTKLSNPEMLIYKFIIANQRTVGCSVNEIANGTKMSTNQIKRLINGRKDREDDDGGMLAKKIGMVKDDVNDTDYIRNSNGELEHSKGRRETRYKINGYNLWDMFYGEFITLRKD